MRTFDHNSGEYLDIDGARIYYEVIGNENSPALLVLYIEKCIQFIYFFSNRSDIFGWN